MLTLEKTAEVELEWLLKQNVFQPIEYLKFMPPIVPEKKNMS